MGELGLHGITVEEEYGGLGLGYLEHVVAMEEVSRASASIGLSYGAHSNLCVNQIRRWGTDEQKRKLSAQADLAASTSARWPCARPARARTSCPCRLRAEKKGDRYVLNGTKFWITNAPSADTLVVYAKTAPATATAASPPS